MFQATNTRALLLIGLSLVVFLPTAHGGGHGLHKKIHEAHQAHAHKKRMKKATNEACKSQKEHHLLHHHKAGG